MNFLSLQVVKLGSSLAVLLIHASLGVMDAFLPLQLFSFLSPWWERSPDDVAMRDVVILPMERIYRESSGLRGKVSLSILPSATPFLTSQSYIFVPEISLHAESPHLLFSHSVSSKYKIPTPLSQAHCRNTSSHLNKDLDRGSFTVSDNFLTKNCPLK